MNFRHELLAPQNIKRVVIDGVRYYETPTGEKYPSVTTVLKGHYHKKKEGIVKWRKRVGEAKATEITTRAASRGTKLHKICENYIGNDPEYKKGAMPTTLVDFQNVRPILDKNLSNVLGIEFPLFSHKFKTAGTADLLCTWGNTPTVLDFKTSRKWKKEEWIEDYFVQASVYGMMANELYSIDIQQLVVILLVENDFPILFQKNINIYEDKVNQIFIIDRPKIQGLTA